MTQLNSPRAKRVLVPPSPEEDALISEGIAHDPDTYELSATEFKLLRRGRPLGSGKKIQVTLRIDADVVERFKATGTGWQTRMNDALKSWSNQHA